MHLEGLRLMSARGERGRAAEAARRRTHDSDLLPDPPATRARKPAVVPVGARWSWVCPCRSALHWETFGTEKAAAASLDAHLFFGTFHRDRGFYERGNYR